MSKQRGSTCYCSEMGAVPGEAESELRLLAAQFQMTLHELIETVVNVSVSCWSKALLKTCVVLNIESEPRALVVAHQVSKQWPV